jgi:aryl-alcohol dehydrogenase-like predicted oxidoreductase
MSHFTRRGFLAGSVAGPVALRAAQPETRPLNYNPNLDYRRLGKTGLMVSSVCLGGHWVFGQLPGQWDADVVRKNRSEVVSACIDHGINYIDACTGDEVMAYAEALRGRRHKMHLGFSWYEKEMRMKEWQTAAKLLEGFEDGLRAAKLDYADLWRITCYWRNQDTHSQAHEEAIVEALDKARKAGKARFTGISTHKHDWVNHMMAVYPDTIQVIVVPYTAASKNAHERIEPGKPGWQAVPDQEPTPDQPLTSVIETARKHDTGWFGIKPFAAGGIFRTLPEDDPDRVNARHELARLTLRHILTSNDALTAPIPGLLSVEEVKNAARAVAERRALDAAERRRLDAAMKRAWASLPPSYAWLRKEWEWV